ncbi:hypothetical protein MASR1M45_02290 [Candidatus Kapaibacterium sp.]
MKIKEQIVRILLFLIITTSAISQSINVKVNDITVERGIKSKLIIECDLTAINPGNLDFTFSYDANVIDVKDIRIQAPYSNTNTISNFINNISNLKNSIMSFTNEVKSENQAKIVYEVEFEGLAGADTLTNFVPLDVKYNSQIITNAGLTGGVIIVNSPSVVPGINEGLGLNRPNPFNDWTTFTIGLNKESEISFTIYRIDGRRVYSDDNIQEIFKVTLLDDNGTEIENYKSKKLPRGNYRLSLQPDSWKLSSGSYFIVLKTVSGVYKQNFMYSK